MIRILPIQTKDEQREKCEACGVCFKLTALAYAAYDDDKFVGISQFGIKGKNGYLYDLANAKGAENADALYIMGRALLSFLELSGVYDAYVDAAADIPRPLTARVGFFPDDEGRLYINLRGIFDAANHKH